LLRVANEARAPQHPARDAHNEGSRRLHDYLHQTASAAGIPDPDGLIEEFELLAQGVISEAARSSTPRAAHVAAHAATRLLATPHPALIPHEVAGNPGRHPRVPARPSSKDLLAAGLPAYSRSARKRQDRPVTPEVAGSSPVAPA